MIKEIPARTEIYCDFCERLCTARSVKGVDVEGERRVQEGEIIIKKHNLDLHGVAAADGTLKYQACDHCLQDVIQAIKIVRDNIRGRGGIDGD